MKPTLLLFFILPFLLFGCGKNTEEATVKRKDITEMLFASGTLEAEEQYNLTAHMEGYIVRLNFMEGDIASKGDVFGVIENTQNDINAKSTRKLLNMAEENASPTAPQLQQVQANMEAAEQKAAQDQKQVERYKKLLEANSIARVEYENKLLALNSSKATLKSLRQQYDNLVVQANQQITVQQQQYDISTVNQGHNRIRIIIPGKVYVLKKQKGDFVRKGDIIATIASPDRIYAYLSIDESNMGKIKLKQKTVIRLNTDRKKLYKAEISEIKPVFDEQAQSFFIKASFTDNLDFRIPGTQLEANILVAKKEGALVIPTAYLGYGNKVILKDGSTKIVQPGIIASDWVEIVGGLSDGTTIKRELKR